MIRKEADTEVPTMFPTLENESNLFDMASAVAATTMEVTITILCWNEHRLNEMCDCDRR
jgi:hypothetical protein